MTIPGTSFQCIMDRRPAPVPVTISESSHVVMGMGSTAGAKMSSNDLSDVGVPVLIERRPSDRICSDALLCWIRSKRWLTLDMQSIGLMCIYWSHWGRSGCVSRRARSVSRAFASDWFRNCTWRWLIALHASGGELFKCASVPLGSMTISWSAGWKK